ncbi:hypothetical protein BJ912DRAFT_940119 [Pholiota molesta]|nr:hypothetical protein BJ912DRAFT_940119 [Pholiota molesta]
MRLLALFFALLAVLATTVTAYLEAAEGKGTTFYSWLDVPSTASTNEIAKAYRKKSMTLQCGIHERFARLGVVSTILRNKESRKRYDFFHKNGVPKWRGTGYYYSRYRPGLGFVAIFLTILTSGLQFMIQKITYRKDLERIELIVSKAKSTAWGPKMVPIPGRRRKVRINLGDAHDEDGVVTGSRFLDMVVEGSQVYLLEPSGELHPIDSSTAIKPTLGNTWFLALRPVPETPSISTGTTGNGTADTDSDGDSSMTGSDAPGSGTSTSQRGEASGRLGPTSKAGGMRRKNLRRK